MKTFIPRVFTVAPIIIIAACVFFGVVPTVGKEIDKWYILSISVACCVGLVNLTQVHVRNIVKRAKDWDLSVLHVVFLYGMLLIGLTKGPTNKTYMWLFDVADAALGSTFYSILAFYIVSAAYRSFRVKNRDATILLVAAVVVLVGRAPLGEYLIPQFGTWTGWIMDVPNAAAMRAATLGVTLGAVITGIRVLLGLERGILSGGS